MADRALEIVPMSGAIGAELHGVDLSSGLSDAELAQVRDAFHSYLVVSFPDQKLSAKQLSTFARRFGPLFLHPHVSPVEGHPEVQRVCKEPDTVNYNFGVTWHTDGSFLQTPALGTMLHAQELPPVGGDTLFSNMYLAYESLSAGMRSVLDELYAAHSGGNTYGPWGARKRKQALGGAPPDDEFEHPVVGVHPVTGRQFLYVNRVFTTNFRAMTLDESLPLLEQLTDHLSRPEFTCWIRWSPNMLVLWDNRATQHCAIDDYAGHRRLLNRVVILSSRG